MSGTLYQNYKIHSRCIRQPATSVNSTVQQHVLVNTKASYPYLSAILSVGFSQYTLRSHIQHTVCLCVSCYYICREVTHKWNINFSFNLPLYVLYESVTEIYISVNIAGSESRNWPERWIQCERHREACKNVWKFISCLAIAVHNLDHNDSKRP